MTSEWFGSDISHRTDQDQYFSERSAIKLLLGNKGNGLTYTETEAKKAGGHIGGNKGLELGQLTVPNTIIEGQFAGKQLATSVVVVEGATIDISEEVDQYRFHFEKGQFINAEVISFWSTFDEMDMVITGLSIYREAADGSLERLLTSYQEFEGFDPIVFDLEIQEEGEYIFEVFAQKFICDHGDCFNVEEIGAGFFNTGKYDLFVYSVDRALGPA
mmetsp:Transcript_64927/g.186827  ORF Transcript_64927/g.186827 Transcript_64927/m.186827 type:complete len:216 (-) Transcript_64927:29-676(-)